MVIVEIIYQLFIHYLDVYLIIYQNLFVGFIYIINSQLTFINLIMNTLVLLIISLRYPFVGNMYQNSLTLIIFYY
jgi:hypothetical protein